MVLLSGSANPELSIKIANQLQQKIYFPCTNFADGEIHVQIPINLRRQSVFIIQPTSKDVNKHVMELILIIDAAKRASALEINVVMPYYGYARQDRKDKPRVPISSTVVAKLLKAIGANRILTIDIHSDQQQGFFDGPWDNLYASHTLIPHIKNYKLKNLVIVSPDKSGTVRAAAYAKRLDADSVAIVYKERDTKVKNESKVLDMIGDVKDKNCLLVDDMIDTGGSIINAANLLKAKGAKRILVAATHGLLSGSAITNLTNSIADKIILTDTVMIDQKTLNAKFEIISISGLLAEAIKRTENGESLSEALLD